MNKSIRSSILISIFLLGISLLSNAQHAKHKIVFHLTTNIEEEHKGLLNNIKNVTEGWKEDVIIEVVAHGPGVSMLMKSSPFTQEIYSFIKNNNIRFSICENTMKQKNINKSQLINHLHYVPMGIARVVELQEQGYAYIKANF